MPILFLTLLLVVILAPLLTQAQFRLVWRAERRQIAVDNAGVVLGRHDREDFRSLERATQRISLAEGIHHPIHVCAHSPTPAAPACQGQDRFWETTLRVMYQTAFQKARFHWALGEVRASQQAARLKEKLGVAGRPLELPVEERVCPVCHLRIGWTKRGQALRYELNARTSERPGASVRVELEGNSRFTGERWDYSLSPGSGE
jgi:hypothetical protein